MKCKNCKVEINNLSDNCPLCGKYLCNTQKSEDVAYPDIEHPKTNKHSYLIKALLFLTIVISISSYAVNILTPHKSMWSIIAICGMWLTWIMVGIHITKRKITPLMIVLDDIVVSIYLNVIDITFGHTGWAMSYAVPFMLCGSALVITIIVMITKINWKEFYLFQMAIVSICFIPLIMSRLISFVFWPSIISAIYGFCTIIGILILGSKKLKNETQKRLHF